MNTKVSEPQFKIGTKYQSTGKRKDICTVIDILKTYNSNNILVQVRYVSEHDFMGQVVRDYDVIGATIARNLI